MRQVNGLFPKTMQTVRAQSRRDGTILTVEFILRTMDAEHVFQVPQGHFAGSQKIPLNVVYFS